VVTLAIGTSQPILHRCKHIRCSWLVLTSGKAGLALIVMHGCYRKTYTQLVEGYLTGAPHAAAYREARSSSARPALELEQCACSRVAPPLHADLQKRCCKLPLLNLQPSGGAIGTALLCCQTMALSQILSCSKVPAPVSPDYCTRICKA